MIRSAFIAVAVAAMSGLPASAHAGTSGAPFSDPAAAGRIGLCDKSGHEITHGSTTARPFVWRAVSSQAPQASYAVAGRTATLYAYQPREGFASSDWSGDQLTAATRYANPAHPTAVATGGDESLQDFITEFAPQWNGLLQLRLYLGAPGRPIDSLSYASTTVRVSGHRWRVLDSAPVSCASGKAVSLETILLPSSTTHSNLPHGSSGHDRHTGSPVSGPPNRLSSGPQRRYVTAAAHSRSSATSIGRHAMPAALVVSGLLLTGLGGLVGVRRRTSRGRP